MRPGGRRHRNVAAVLANDQAGWTFQRLACERASSVRTRSIVTKPLYRLEKLRPHPASSSHRSRRGAKPRSTDHSEGLGSTPKGAAPSHGLPIRHSRRGRTAPATLTVGLAPPLVPKASLRSPCGRGPIQTNTDMGARLRAVGAGWQAGCLAAPGTSCRVAVESTFRVWWPCGPRGPASHSSTLMLVMTSMLAFPPDFHKLWRSGS